MEGWVADGLARGDAPGRAGEGDGFGVRGGGMEGMGQGVMGQEDWKELWEWAPLAANEVAKEEEWLVGEWTPEEKAQGLHLEEEGGGDGDEDMEDEEEEEEEEEDRMNLEEVLRFMSTGVLR